MSLNQKDQELLDALYPDGYIVEGLEVNYFHLLFIKIFEIKSRENKVNAMVQKMSPRDYDVMMRQVNKGWSLASLTGYDEFAIIHNPREVKDKPKEMVSTPVEKMEATPVPESETKPKSKTTKPGPKAKN